MLGHCDQALNSLSIFWKHRESLLVKRPEGNIQVGEGHQGRGGRGGGWVCGWDPEGGFYSFSQLGCLTVSLLQVQNSCSALGHIGATGLSSFCLTRLAR